MEKPIQTGKMLNGEKNESKIIFTFVLNCITFFWGVGWGGVVVFRCTLSLNKRFSSLMSNVTVH